MKATDLRLGNILERGVVSGIATEFVEYAGMAFDGAIFEVSSETPIPLTEEWLVRFGFEEALWSSVVYILHGFTIIPGTGLAGTDELVVSSWYIKELELFITDVHQLQNIIHALTGKELEFISN